MLTTLFNGYQVHLVQKVEELSIIRGLLDERVSASVDTETSGLDYTKDTIAGVCISCGHAYDAKHYHGFYLPVDHISYEYNLPKKEVFELVQYVIDNYTTAWWNRDYDATMLEKEGIIMPCVGKTHDIQCMAHLIKGDSLPALKDFAQDYLKWSVLHYSDNNAENGSFKTTDPRTSYVYAAGDPVITALLGRKIWNDYPYIRKIYPIDNKFAESMRWFMQRTELFLDKNKVQELLDENARDLQKIKTEIFAFVGYQFRLDSNVEKAEALSRYVTLTAKTTNGQFAVNKEALGAIDHPLAKMLLKYVTLNKFRSTYLKKMVDFPQGFHINYQHCNVSCLTENNTVRTLGGYKSIRDVSVGDYVLSENGFFRVTNTAQYQDKVLRVTLRNGAYIEGNAKHPVLCNGEWVGLGDLRDGMRVTMCRTTHINDTTAFVPDIKQLPRCRVKVTCDTKVDVDLARLLGFLDGDGSLVEDGVKLCFSKFEPECEEFYTKLFAAKFHMELPKRQEGKDNTIQYKFCSKSLVNWLKELGIREHGINKGIDFSKWSSECQFAYVAALIDTDGSLVPQRKESRFNIVYCSTSFPTVEAMATILRFHGMDVHVTKQEKDRKQTLYNVRLRSFSRYGIFREYVAPYMICNKKRTRLDACKWDLNHPYSRWATKEESSEVVNIEWVGVKTVYDITVGKDHTFIANGIVTHNTGRLSSGGSKGNPFYVGFNIQNVPKIEMMKYIHRSTQSPIKWWVDMDPHKCLPVWLQIKTPGGYKSLDNIVVGDKIETSKGEKEVMSVGPYRGYLKPMEGVLVRANDEWEVHSTFADEDGYYLDCGEDCYSVKTKLGDVQIRTLTQVKVKGGMRDCFVPPEGYVWISCDYAAQEIRCLANLSKETVLIEPLLQGQDIHKFVATKMFGHYDPMHRTIAKTITFAANYGGTAYTIAKRLGVSEKEAEQLLARYNATLKRATAWKEASIKEGRRKGMVFTYFGRPRAVWMWYQSSSKKDHGFGDRTCMNSPIQGAGGDVIRMDYIKFKEIYTPGSSRYDEEFATKVKHALTVHDETNWFVRPDYVKKGLEKVQEVMNIKMPNWEVPLIVTPSVGLSWGTNFDVKGFEEDGTVIPDTNEDINLL